MIDLAEVQKKSVASVAIKTQESDPLGQIVPER